MRRLLLSIATLMAALAAHAQPFRIWQGIPKDSTVISFCDTIASINTGMSIGLDTSHTSLWRTGSSSKAFFSGTPGRRYGIMTDTANPYPVSQNEWFTVKMTSFALNPIFSFRHRFETDSSKDGGIVEYSFDSTDWNNVIGGCFSRVFVDSFYDDQDTVTGGAYAFSGTSAWKTSTFQIFRGIPIKEAGACEVRFPLWVRFRFRSDTTADTLAGWQIQWLKIEADQYNGGVPGPKQLEALAVSPNPSASGVFNFPELPGGELLQLEVTDVTGRLVARQPYGRQLDLSALQPGCYYYQVGGYRGRLLRP